MKDAFFSEEDLDLRHLSFAELNRVWNAWLRQAQATNEYDRREYSHGVFTLEPEASPDGQRRREEESGKAWSVEQGAGGRERGAGGMELGEPNLKLTKLQT
jgi:hypothetical protein